MKYFLFIIIILGMFIIGCSKPVIVTPTDNNAVQQSANNAENPVAQIPSNNQTSNPEPKITQKSDPIAQPTVKTNTTQAAPTPIVSNSGKISQSELAIHNSRNDCWVSYNGKVYDITNYLPKHPGGIGAISSYCGTSGAFQFAFQNQHGTSKVGILEKQGLLKGTLAQ